MVPRFKQVITGEQLKQLPPGTSLADAFKILKPIPIPLEPHEQAEYVLPLPVKHFTLVASLRIDRKAMARPTRAAQAAISELGGMRLPETVQSQHA